MTWNYRVVREVLHGEEEFSLREIYYKDGKITMWSTDRSAPGGSTYDDLVGDLNVMMAALEQPVLNIVDLPGYADEE